MHPSFANLIPGLRNNALKYFLTSVIPTEFVMVIILCMFSSFKIKNVNLSIHLTATRQVIFALAAALRAAANGGTKLPLFSSLLAPDNLCALRY
jgi:hypothetical protein